MESSANLHEAANAAVEHMDTEAKWINLVWIKWRKSCSTCALGKPLQGTLFCQVRQRILLHHGCLFEMQSDWQQACMRVSPATSLQQHRFSFWWFLVDSANRIKFVLIGRAFTSTCALGSCLLSSCNPLSKIV